MSWAVGSIYISPALQHPYPPDYWEKCGQNTYCRKAANDYTKSCGTWLGLSEYCCSARVNSGSTVLIQPCDAVTGIQEETFSTFGSPSFNSSSCTDNGWAIFDYDPKGGEPIKTCCKKATNGYLQLNGANEERELGSEYIVGFRCGNFEITEVNGSKTNGENTGEPSPSPTSSSSSGGSSSGGGGGSEPVSSSGSSTTTTSSPTSGSASGGQSTPNTASRQGLTKVASFVLGSAFLAALVGAQL
ncbi:hypothetical protein H072_6276 [Dactylellina haptotyla CBS 200.50]|uniref:Uncharacterized protein n=1 Tax=Dactylellina haptotyla (strain CBS 200.50) TaxID=1284197 RepID=S8AFI1_DACHA|nr:hypothetical protein H072_6276 [Dactylellina haptotyla CBS 200.50]